MIGRGHRGATKLAFRSLNCDSIGCCGSLVVALMPRGRVNSESRKPAASAGAAVRRQGVCCAIRVPVAVVVKAAADEMLSAQRYVTSADVVAAEAGRGRTVRRQTLEMGRCRLY